MKKIFLLLCLVVLLTGCNIETINNDNIDLIIEKVLMKDIDLANSYFSGYKYYLPRGLKIVNKKEYNAKLVSGKNSYYLFVDVIAYYNKIQPKFTPSNSYYSKELNYNNKKGYIEITEYKDLYFIEIMYNHAKIEALVSYEDINETIINSCYVLSSIQFNDNVIETLIGDNVLDYKETLFDIFGPNKDTDGFLDYSEEYQHETEKKDSDVLDSSIDE